MRFLEARARSRARSCDSAQGYYLSRPLPAGELTAWLTKQAAHSTNDAQPSSASIGTHRETGDGEAMAKAPYRVKGLPLA